MNKLFYILCFVLVFTSCSSDDNDGVSIIGVWELTAWDVMDGFDINNDGTASTNIIDEIECTNNETLIFEDNGVMSSNETYNPDINIALLEGTTDEYMFNVSCDEQGIIGFATSYSQTNNTVIFNDIEFTVIDNQLFRVIKESVKIYNEDFTEVVATKDLKLVYTKR
ncbi:hypothetical protein [Flavivirga jejuensis]|uniref:Lipocalin-like domain-containing protein n=1 Tax=Flavivirga jejuensis TaxID=870487 RepID=A0ABT8WLZ1_9FLAO|nr:hypothetical protein [Flavivirga jejuensis]MDO5974164.1 hypothetical protein [Flavivirga jejuensis]